MKNLEFNKIMGALLFVCFVVAFGSNVTDVIFGSLSGGGHGAERGYTFPVPEDSPGAGAGVDASTKLENFLTATREAIASANIEAGQSVSKKCASCHTFTQGGRNGVGPNLFGVVNRPIASHEGFTYSAAMLAHASTSKVDPSSKSAVSWTEDELIHYLHDPKGRVKGNKMAFAGIGKPKEMADLIKYLESLK